MASYNKFQDFVGHLGIGKNYDLNTDTLKVYLSAVAPSASLDSVKTDLAEISAGNGYTAGGDDITNTAAEPAGTLKVSAVDVVVTAPTGPSGASTERTRLRFPEGSTRISSPARMLPEATRPAYPR